MALIKTVVTVYDIEVVDAYHRVEAVSLIGKNAMRFHLRSYKDIEKPFFYEQVISCAYDIEGSNPIEQAYIHVKTMDEFADAEDC